MCHCAITSLLFMVIVKLCCSSETGYFIAYTNCLLYVSLSLYLRSFCMAALLGI